MGGQRQRSNTPGHSAGALSLGGVVSLPIPWGSLTRPAETPLVSPTGTKRDPGVRPCQQHVPVHSPSRAGMLLGHGPARSPRALPNKMILDPRPKFCQVINSGDAWTLDTNWQQCKLLFFYAHKKGIKPFKPSLCCVWTASSELRGSARIAPAVQHPRPVTGCQQHALCLTALFTTHDPGPKQRPLLSPKPCRCFGQAGLASTPTSTPSLACLRGTAPHDGTASSEESGAAGRRQLGNFQISIYRFFLKKKCHACSTNASRAGASLQLPRRDVLTLRLAAHPPASRTAASSAARPPR